MTTEPASLTEEEAADRAALLTVDRYDISVDLRDLLEGERWRATSTIRFSCEETGGSTFVDCVGEVAEATLNGIEIDLSAAADELAQGRIPLAGLVHDNELVVTSTQSDTASGNAILRTVDSSDKLVYVWSTFEPDRARFAWACFDQPDLKAPHRFVVDAPSAWTVTSNCAPDSVEDNDDGGRRWSFPDTPTLSTYVVVINAGPFHEIREERGGNSLGLYCRQSLKRFLERDAEELFRVTEQGLAFFGERFGVPFGQERYDQVFVPNFGGAMENWGCVTWTDDALFRHRPTYSERQGIAVVLLHEMAHMWFGDLVTMRWWDDLWLNEAFASFAATWAAVNATEYTDAWAAHLVGRQTFAYEMDRGPASHAIRGRVPDVAQAMANFDNITYDKGQAVLRQLMEYVGEDNFVEGLRAYFADHAWGNTRLSDLIDAVGTAADRDLSGWSESWFDRAGTDTLTLVGDSLLATSPDGDQPRRHRLRIGSYRRSNGALERVGDAELETTGTATHLADLPEADLHLVNDGDLTYAAARTDEASLETMLALAPQLPDTISRTLVVTTGWDMLAKGELSSGDFLDCALRVAEAEPSAGVVERMFAIALAAAEQWSPTSMVPRRLGRVADAAMRRVEEPDHHKAALNVLAASAGTEEQFDLLDSEAENDVDLAWRVLVRRASLGRYDAEAVESLQERDPDPEAYVRGWSVTAARPAEEAKAEAWAHVFTARDVPIGRPLAEFARAFWRPVQHDLLVPWADRFLDDVNELGSAGMLATLSITSTMAPTTCDEAWLERARDLAAQPDTSPTVSRVLLTTADTLSRVLRARE